MYYKVPNCEHYYATENGDIYSNARGKMRKMSVRVQKGYPYVCVHINGKQKMVLVHRMVYKAFYGEIPKGMQIDHVDGNKLNSSIENLEMVTPRENQIRASKNGLRKKVFENAFNKNSNFQKAARISRARINAERSKKVICLETNKVYPSILNASIETNISRGVIQQSIKKNRKTKSGYTWQLAI